MRVGCVASLPMAFDIHFEQCGNRRYNRLVGQNATSLSRRFTRLYGLQPLLLTELSAMDTARTASLATLNTLAERCGHVTQSFVDQVQLGLFIPVLHAMPALLFRLLLTAEHALPALPFLALPAMGALPAMPCYAMPCFACYALLPMLCLLWFAVLCPSCTPTAWLHGGGWGAGRAVWAVPG